MMDAQIITEELEKVMISLDGVEALIGTLVDFVGSINTAEKADVWKVVYNARRAERIGNASLDYLRLTVEKLIGAVNDLNAMTEQ